MRRILLALLIFTTWGCKKNHLDTQTPDIWSLKSYVVEYYDQAGTKVYQEHPAELQYYDNIILTEKGFSLAESTPNNKISKAITLNINDTDSQTLPVRFISFNGKLTKEGIQLTWATATEEQNSHFDIYRGRDSILFLFVERINGIGNSDTIQHYSFLDKFPAKGANYYMLNQIDKNGTSTLYYTIYVLNDSTGVSGYAFIKNTDGIFLPFSLYQGIFKEIEVKQISNTEMIWEGSEKNLQYVEDGIIKSSAYSILTMRYGRIQNH